MMGNWSHGGWGTMGPFDWIGGLLFLALLVVGIFYLWRALGPGQSFPQGGEQVSSKRTRALSIARERYANGEIGNEEFEQLKRDLS